MGELRGSYFADKIWNFTFTGQANVRAMIANLIKYQGLGKNPEDIEIFVGD